MQTPEVVMSHGDAQKGRAVKNCRQAQTFPGRWLKHGAVNLVVLVLLGCHSQAWEPTVVLGDLRASSMDTEGTRTILLRYCGRKSMVDATIILDPAFGSGPAVLYAKVAYGLLSAGMAEDEASRSLETARSYIKSAHTELAHVYMNMQFPPPGIRIRPEVGEQFATNISRELVTREVRYLVELANRIARLAPGLLSATLAVRKGQCAPIQREADGL